MKPCSIAVVGGGLAGLSCASKLLELLPHAHATVIDMGQRGPGGRASTRRQEGFQFDHGCQFVRWPNLQASDGTRNQLAESVSAARLSWEREGALAKWSERLGMLDATSGEFTPRNADSSQQPHTAATGTAGFCGLLGPGDIYVGTPSMDALCHSLAAQHAGRLTPSWNTKVCGMEQQEDGRWLLQGTSGPDASAQELGAFHAVVLSDAMAGRSGSPGFIQSQSRGVQQLLERLRDAKAAPRLTLMAAFPPQGLPSIPFDAATVSGNDAIECISNDSSKPGRARADDAACWVAVSTEAFARHAIAQSLPLQVNGNFNPADPQQMASVTSEMLRHLGQLLAPFASHGDGLPRPLFAASQRWGSCLYPSITDDAAEALLCSADGTVAAVGDHLAGSEVQRIVLQAHATAFALADTLSGS